MECPSEQNIFTNMNIYFYQGCFYTSSIDFTKAQESIKVFCLQDNRLPKPP